MTIKSNTTEGLSKWDQLGIDTSPDVIYPLLRKGPLVLSTSGGLGPAARTFYKWLASLIAEKHNQPFSLSLFWLRAKLGFSLIRSAIMCLRGSRSSYHRGESLLDSAIDLSCSAGRND